MDNAPRWVEQILAVLEECIECYSPSALDVRFISDECHLVIAPAPAEIVGGKEDGQEVFVFFSAHLSEIVKAFDALPEMSWDTMYDELHVEGEFSGQDGWITLRKFPVEDDKIPGWLIERGMLRRRNDTS